MVELAACFYSVSPGRCGRALGASECRSPRPCVTGSSSIEHKRNMSQGSAGTSAVGREHHDRNLAALPLIATVQGFLPGFTSVIASHDCFIDGGQRGNPHVWNKPVTQQGIPSVGASPMNRLGIRMVNTPEIHGARWGIWYPLCQGRSRLAQIGGIPARRVSQRSAGLPLCWSESRECTLPLSSQSLSRIDQITSRKR